MWKWCCYDLPPSDIVSTQEIKWAPRCRGTSNSCLPPSCGFCFHDEGSKSNATCPQCHHQPQLKHLSACSTASYKHLTGTTHSVHPTGIPPLWGQPPPCRCLEPASSAVTLVCFLPLNSHLLGRPLGFTYRYNPTICPASPEVWPHPGDSFLTRQCSLWDPQVISASRS